MEDLLNLFVERLLGRIDGPMGLRFCLQPIMAAMLAIRDGWADVKAGHAPYFLSLFTEPENRGKKLWQGWKSIRRVFWLAVVLDLGYQFLELPRIRPLSAVFVAIILAIIPYLLVRGLVRRVMAAVYGSGK